jgi:hypothetical protein
VNPVVCQSKTVKPKKGYYVATGDDNNCLVIKKVKGNKITFQLGWYSELRIGTSKTTTVTIKNGKAKYKIKLDGWDNEVTTGTIKIVNSKKIKIKSNGGAFYAADTSWRTYKYDNSSTVLD